MLRGKPSRTFSSLPSHFILSLRTEIVMSEGMSIPDLIKLSIIESFLCLSKSPSKIDLPSPILLQKVVFPDPGKPIYTVSPIFNTNFFKNYMKYYES